MRFFTALLGAVLLATTTVASPVQRRTAMAAAQAPMPPPPGDAPIPGPPEKSGTRITFDSNGLQLVGYHHAPAGSADGKAAPIVILAHGLGGLQSSRLPPFAEAFAKAGYNALTFDYSYWGESAGTPRNLIDISGQQADYLAAVAAAKKLPGVDPQRIVIWGSSLSGGHVLELGARTPSLAGVIAQAPHVNGPRTVLMLPLSSIPALTAVAIGDFIWGGILRQAPTYVPIANATGQWGALTQEGALDGYKFVQPSPPPPGNVLAARFIVAFPFFSPDWSAHRSRVPTFIGVAKNDKVTPPAPALALAERMNATLGTYEGGHFDVYPGASRYDAIFADQLAFLHKVVPI